MKTGHLKLLITAACSSAITAAILTLPQLLSTVSAAPPAAPLGQIARTPVVSTTIDIQGTTYRMDVIEIAFDVGAALPLHQHPSPSLGYVTAGRFSITVAADGQTNSYSAGGGVVHPWNSPHVMVNTGTTPATMLSFELNPLDQ
jgi:quercetin dioxygenase-like cupin family protein